VRLASTPRRHGRALVFAAALVLSLFTFAGSASGDYLNLYLQAGTMHLTSYTCNPDGTSTVSFTASGTSIASYPGPYTASGTFTLGPQNLPGYYDNNYLPAGRLLTWTENFSVDSPAGALSGVSTGIVLPPPGFGMSGATINTGTCTYAENVTLSQVQNATGTVIQVYGTVGMTVDGAGLPSDTFAASIAVEMMIQSSSVGSFTVGGLTQMFFSGAIGPADTTPPVLTVPADLTVEAASAGGAAVTFAVSASDDVDPAPVVACTPASGATFPLGDTTVACTATDASGNVASASFDVHVRDRTAPTLTTPAGIAVDATSQAGAIATFAVTAADAVDPSPVVACTPASGATFAIGDTTVACTATDASGNASTASFAVHVRSAAEQLTALRAHAASLGLQPLVARSLDAELLAAQMLLAHGQPKAAALALAVFDIEVRVLPPGVIAPADAASLVTDANRIRHVLGV